MSDLEAAFDYYWRALDGPELRAEQQLNSVHGWKFDRVHVATKVVIEIEGGTMRYKTRPDGTREYVGGRHNRGPGFEADCIKYNWAAAHDYAVFRLTSGMLTQAPAEHLEPIIALIRQRLEYSHE